MVFKKILEKVNIFIGKESKRWTGKKSGQLFKAAAGTSALASNILFLGPESAHTWFSYISLVFNNPTYIKRPLLIGLSFKMLD